MLCHNEFSMALGYFIKERETASLEVAGFDGLRFHGRILLWSLPMVVVWLWARGVRMTVQRVSNVTICTWNQRLGSAPGAECHRMHQLAPATGPAAGMP